MSCFSKLFSAEQNHTNDLGELGRYYRRYERLMAIGIASFPPAASSTCAARMWWPTSKPRRAASPPTAGYRGIIAACGSTRRPVRTASATQVRQPIYNNAVGRWCAYEQHLGPLRDALGAR